MKKYLILAAAVAVMASCSAPSVTKLMADESERQTQTILDSWSFRQIGTDNWMPATVPGVVHTDLLNNGKIDDPYFSTNEPTLQWIEHEQWEYKTTFTPSAALLASATQELVFKGLDTYADVYLNDSLVLSGDNMFYEWRIPATGLLHEGSNSLRILFHSAYAVGKELAKALPVRLPADNDKGEVKTSVFTRKAPYQFGWDWGPRYATVGIWRPVQIEGYTTASINNIQFIQTSQSDTKATIDAHVTLNGAATAAVRVTIADSIGQIWADTTANVTKGATTTITLPITIKNPKLWWPAGMGDANLYAVNTIVSMDDKKLDQNTQSIGIRTIRLLQEPDSVGEGIGFMFEVNGQECFIKGANYIPQDVFLPRVDSARYQQMIADTRASNMNMLRIWGGGIYEEDLFYDLCDQNGIMVWQDFIFGCSLYPWDEAFLANVEKEAIYNVRRLRNHPSLAIWCGNNEITELWHQWGYQKAYKWTQAEQDMILKGMKDLFYGLLPRVLATEDTTRFYHPSSPLHGRGNPLSQIQGDVHYWGVFHDEEPFSVYKDKPGRFSNEYGFQSLACYDTYREYFTPEDMKLYSPAMVIHQKNPKGYRVIEEYMVRDLPLLKDDFRTYVYLTQLLQAEGIKIAMEGHRSKRPFTMGSMYWQINDCWPVASWSSMDSEMRWKALQYYARRSFAPTMLSFERIDSSATSVLWGLNDQLEAQSGNVTITLMDFNGKTLSSEDISVDIPANGNKELSRRADKDLLKGANPREVFMVASGTVGGEPMEAIYYFVPFKDLALPKADFDVSYEKKGTQVIATIKANKLLKSVLFEAEALQNNASDAYFDLLPGQQRVITLNFKEDTPVEDLGIFVTSLNNLVGKPSAKPITKNVQ